MTIWFVLYMVVFLTQFAVGYGLTLGYFQGKFARIRSQSDFYFAVWFSFATSHIPGMLFLTYCLSKFGLYGLKFKTQGPIEDGKYGYDIFGNSQW